MPSGAIRSLYHMSVTSAAGRCSMWMSAPVAGYDMFGRRKTLSYYRNVWSPKMTEEELLEKLEFVQEMKSISSSITDKIVSVDLTPSKVTKDLITITMKNDNKILVPVSQITRKLPYYKAISKQLDDDSTIDMEAGVFSYSEQSIADAKEQAEKEKAESTENQEEHSEEASQEQNPEGENSSGNE